MSTTTYATTRRTAVNRETVKPVSAREKTRVEVVGSADLVLIDGIVPRELATHICALARLYRDGKLILG